jgi:hypothetical protein
MKTLAQLLRSNVNIVAVLLISLFVFSCSDKCEVTNTYTYFEPVYATKAEIKAAIGLRASQVISNAGRIYFKDGILFINESGEGIHIIDNRNPASPMPMNFLNIPGNYDLAIIGNTLYADSYVDLIAFDISNLSSIKEVGRMEGLFDHYNTFGFMANDTWGMITDWKEIKKVSISESGCESQLQPWGGMLYENGIAFDSFAAKSFDGRAAVAPTGNLGSSANTGIGGSMARFTIANNYLYALDDSKLDIVSLASPRSPVAKNEIQLNWWPETLFPNGNSLFIGTRNGMFIFDINTPDNPKQLSAYQHIVSCDPVVVEGDYAYVTLYAGGCGNLNQLEVVNISNLSSPQLVKTYPFTSPHGVGIDNGILFICDGNDGLKIFDASDVNAITSKQLAHYPNINALDVIPFNDVAMMIGSDGLYQYSYGDIKNIKLLSKIAIERE